MPVHGEGSASDEPPMLHATTALVRADLFIVGEVAAIERGGGIVDDGPGLG